MLRLLRKKLNKLAQNYTFFSKYANNHERKCKKTDFFSVSIEKSVLSHLFTPQYNTFRTPISRH